MYTMALSMYIHVYNRIIFHTQHYNCNTKSRDLCNPDTKGLLLWPLSVAVALCNGPRVSRSCWTRCLTNLEYSIGNYTYRCLSKSGRKRWCCFRRQNTARVLAVLFLARGAVCRSDALRHWTIGSTKQLGHTRWWKKLSLERSDRWQSTQAQ